MILEGILYVRIYEFVRGGVIIVRLMLGYRSIYVVEV